MSGVRIPLPRPVLVFKLGFRSINGGRSSVGRAQDCDSCGRGFEPRRPPQSFQYVTPLSVSPALPFRNIDSDCPTPLSLTRWCPLAFVFQAVDLDLHQPGGFSHAAKGQGGALLRVLAAALDAGRINTVLRCRGLCPLSFDLFSERVVHSRVQPRGSGGGRFPARQKRRKSARATIKPSSGTITVN